jgi:outer membrane protein
MRKFLLTLLCLGAVLTLDAAAELNIRFVNSEIILQQYRAVQGVVETFNRDVQGWNDEAQRRKREIEELQRELESQSLMLSNERRQEKDMEYQRRLNEYEQYVQSIWGPEGLVEQRNEELLRPIINKVQTLLAQIAAEEGYDFILDAADNNILYADPEHDLTQDIVDLLNSEEVGD